MNEKLEILVALAQEVEVGDPIEWGMLAVSEEETYRLMALSIMEQFPDENVSILAVVLKLVVENFVLNLRLLQRG
jgi:hypothetical protein